MISLCSDWEFTREWNAGFCHGEGRFPCVSLPHTAGEVPLHYAKPEDYAGVCGYRRMLSIPVEYRRKRLFLQFDGAAHFAEVYLNGEKIAAHSCGYTAFRVEITSLVRYGMENRLAVRLDTTENPAVPPFGFVLDYLAYGGLYREVWLDVRGADVIEDVFVTTPTLTRAEIALTVSGSGARRRVTLLDAAGAVCAMTDGDGNKYYVNYSNARPWTLDEPDLYSIRAELLDASGAVTDEKTVRFGFRTAEFRRSGFYLNGERVFLRGLNRHQCYPYMGYAAPEALQREDARILKEELCCTAVRTACWHLASISARALLPSATKLPLPLRVSMTPASLRICRALRTVMRLTPIISMSSFSLGSRSPFLYTPCAIMLLTCSSTCVYSLTPVLTRY